MKGNFPYIVCILLSMSGVSSAQDLESVGERKLLSYSGGIGVNTTFYHAQGIDSRRDPFFWQLNANLNFDFLGLIQAPFSLTISQQSKNFSQPQPFNRFGISPSYRGLTLHLGHRSMSFSNYTLSGSLFFGAGAEYQPKTSPLRVSMLYGRFAKPVARFASDGITFANPTFRRLGYGAKVGWENEGQEAHVMVFRAYDDQNSIPVTDSLTVTPEENLVVGVVTNLKFLQKFNWTLDYAHSLHTSNTRSEEVFIDEFTFVNNLGNLFTPRASSSFTTAYQTAVVYSGDKFQLNTTYRRVDPGFRTLGSSFLNNDLEDLTSGISFPLLRSKLQLSGSVGMQRNNLNNQLTASVRRLVYSSAATINVSDQTNLMLNYSNFNSSTRQSIIQEDILVDSLEFFQVSRNASLNINHGFGESENQKNLSLFSSLQDATDSEGNASTFFSGALSYQMRLYKVWNMTLTGSVNQNVSGEVKNLTAGPVVNVNRSFAKGKYRVSFSSGALNVYDGGTLQSNVNNFKLAGNMRAGKKHNFSVSSFYVIKRTPAAEAGKVVREFRANINYSFRL